MSENNIDVKKIMQDILSKENDSETTITPENLVSIVTKTNQETIKNILDETSARSKELEYLLSLNFNTKQRFFPKLKNHFQNELELAIESSNIQIHNKINTSKNALIKKLILKIRHTIQGEVRFALDPIVNNQIKFNTHMINCISELNNNILIANIHHVYNSFLNREPTENEILDNFSLLHKEKMSLGDFIKKIKKSTEYSNLQEEKKLQDLVLFKKFSERQQYLEILKIERKKSNPNSICFIDFSEILSTNTNPFSERPTEYLWVLKNLPTSGRLLDVGCLDSKFANELTKIKNLDIYGVDIRTPNEDLLYNFKQENATNLSFENNYFDFVTVISAIEHFGFDVYGGDTVDDADKLAITEIIRVLKPQGLLFLTIPFGKNQKSWSRVYNIESLQTLLEHFEILDEKYFEQKESGWTETTKQIACLNEGAIFRKNEESSGAIACILARVKK